MKLHAFTVAKTILERLHGKKKTAMVTVANAVMRVKGKKVSKWSQPSEMNVIRSTTRVLRSYQNCEKHLRVSRASALFSRLPAL